MGTSVGWKSKQDLVDYIASNGGPGIKLLDKALVGNVLYIAYADVENGGCSIDVYLLGYYKGAGPGGNDWGYKGMNERNGPYYYSCPERLLKLSTCEDKTAVTWRIQCREERHGKLINAKNRAKLAPGVPVTIWGKPYTVIGKYDPRKGGKPGWLVQNPAGQTYRAIKGIEVAA